MTSRREKKTKSCRACGSRYEEGTGRIHGMEWDSIPYSKDGLLRSIHDGEAISVDWANEIVKTVNLISTSRRFRR